MKITAGVKVDHPGGGWKPSETCMDFRALPNREKPLDLPIERHEVPAADNDGTPLESWPCLGGCSLPGQALPYVDGATVILKGLSTKNGTTGTLLKRSGTNRWRVRLNNEKGVALLREEYLQVIDPDSQRASVQLPPTAGRKTDAPPHPAAVERGPLEVLRPDLAAVVPCAAWKGHPLKYFIIGSWNNWKPDEMKWDDARHCYRCRFQVGSRGYESFLVLIGSKQHLCLHPPGICEGDSDTEYEYSGPDPLDHCGGKYWVLGKTAANPGMVGEFVEVRANHTSVQWERRVEWSKEFPELGGSQFAVCGDGWMQSAEVSCDIQAERLDSCLVPVSRQRFLTQHVGRAGGVDELTRTVIVR